MKIQSIIVSCIVVLLLFGGAFYGGMRYDRVKNPLPSGGFANMANLSSEERQARAQQFGANGAGRQRGTQAGGGFINGEIIAKDDQSITLKLSDGGSKIVFFADSTQISKSATGAREDLTVGSNLTVSGSANQDGSLTAQSIQIRPAGSLNGSVKQ